MSDKRYVVPEGMIEAANRAISEARLRKSAHFPSDPELWPCDIERISIEAALIWLSENPIAPTMQQLQAIYDSPDCPKEGTYVPYYLCEWQRRMFLAPEPEVLEAISDLLYKTQGRIGCDNPIEVSEFIRESDRRVYEAYNRGKAGK